MSRRITMTLLLIWIFTGGYSQIDTCPINPYIQGNYVNDAYVLVGRMLENPQHPFHDSIDIPLVLLEKPLAALSTAYEVNSPEKDTVFNIYNIHVRGANMGMLGRLIIWVDTSYAWVQQLIANDTFSGNPAYDTMMASRGFIVHYVFSFSTIIVVISPGNYNLTALIDKLLLIPGITQAYPDALAGDGSDITYAQGDNTDSLIFDLGWGDCPSGCIHHRYWLFAANPNCTGNFLFAYGSPIQQPAAIADIRESQRVYPNPFSDILNICLPGSQVLRVELYSMSGSLIRSVVPDAGRVNFPGLPDGTYMLRAVSPSGNTLLRTLVLKHNP